MKKNIFLQRKLFWIPVLLMLFLVFIQTHRAQAAVVVSIKPIHSLVQGVLGNTEEAQLIVNGPQSPHGFQLKPSQMRMLEEADTLFYIDEYFETFLQKPLRSLSKNTRVIALSQSPGIQLLPARSEKQGHVDHHGIYDLHIWLDPVYAQKMLTLITRELSLRKPERRLIYEKNAQQLQARLVALDQLLQTRFQTLNDKPFIVFHDAYQYLEKRYHLNHQGSITMDPYAAASIKHIQTLRNIVLQKKIICVFREPQFSDRLISVVSEGNRVKSSTLDPIGATLSPSPDLYFVLLEQLSVQLKNCLSS